MTPARSEPIYTIGHSNHPYPDFLRLLTDAGIAAVADVRSVPKSRRNPQFSREALDKTFEEDGIDYLYLGDALGGRPQDPACCTEGRADYEKMEKSEAFKRGLERVIDAAGQRRLALMCAEKDPLNCHRCLLVAPALVKAGAEVKHILADGGIVSHWQVEERLLEEAGAAAEDLFSSREERLGAAYRARSGNLARAPRRPL